MHTPPPNPPRHGSVGTVKGARSPLRKSSYFSSFLEPRRTAETELVRCRDPSSVPADWATIQGSVISFESCMLAVEAAHGFDVILERAHPVCCCDGSLRMALHGTPDADTFRAAMSSFNPCPLLQPAARMNGAAP